MWQGLSSISTFILPQPTSMFSTQYFYFISFSQPSFCVLALQKFSFYYYFIKRNEINLLILWCRNHNNSNFYCLIFFLSLGEALHYINGRNSGSLVITIPFCLFKERFGEWCDLYSRRGYSCTAAASGWQDLSRRLDSWCYSILEC